MENLDRHYAYLIRLNQLIELDYTVRARVPKADEEIQADFKRQEAKLASLVGVKWESEATNCDAQIGHRRRYQRQEREILRQSRANIFAIAFSTFEKYLEVRFPLAKKIGVSKFFGFKAYFEELSVDLPYFATPAFSRDWRKADEYRQVRNVITHQGGLFDSEEDINPLMAAQRSDFFSEAVDFPDGFKEVVIGEMGLPDIIDFFQTFALRIDVEASGAQQKC